MIVWYDKTWILLFSSFSQLIKRSRICFSVHSRDTLSHLILASLILPNSMQDSCHIWIRYVKLAVGTVRGQLLESRLVGKDRFTFFCPTLPRLAIHLLILRQILSSVAYQERLHTLFSCGLHDCNPDLIIIWKFYLFGSRSVTQS